MNPPTHSEAQPFTHSRWNRLAWLPIPLLLAAIIAARMAGLRDIYESHMVLLVLSFTFYTLVSLGTLYLIGRSFLALGVPGLLLLECGVIFWSLAGTVGDFVSHGDANINVSIFNIGILLAGLCHLAGTILALRPQRVLRAKPIWLGAGFAFALGALWLVSHAALMGWLPVFFIPGHGGTPMRYIVLGSAITLFVLSASLLKANQRMVHLPFTSWYALALLMLAVGLFGVMIQLSLGSVVNWLSRAAQWLGGVYLLFAALAALNESQLPLLPQQRESSPVYYRDAVAVAMVLAAAAIRLAFLSAMGMRAPFVTFYPAVIFASIYGGLRAGLLATALSAIVVDYFWIEPVGQFYIGQTSDWLAIMTFLLTGAMIAGVSDAMHRARVSASAAEKQALLAAERAAAAETLYETRAKLEAALESMSDAVFISDTDGNFIDFNEAFATFHKLRNKDECAKTFAEYPDILDVFMADGTLAPLDMWAVPRALRGETGTNVEYTLRRKDTGQTWVGSYSFGPIRDKDGMIVGSVVVGRDVTERKRAEEAVSRSQKTLFELVERSPFGIYVVDSQFRITLMNTGSQNGAFRNVRPVIGRPFDEAMRILWPEDVAVEIIAHFRHTLDTGEPYYSRKFINPRHDEKIVESYEWELHRMTLPDGQYGVICYYFDSTILRQAEEALRQSEARWNAAIENFGEGAIIATEDEQVIYWNPAARAMHGFTSAEEGIGPLRETPITFQLWTPDGQHLLELDEWPMRRIKRGETVRHLELCLRRPDQGWEKIVSYSGAMVGTASGERLIFLSVYDLTELRKAEEALKTALQRLNALVAGMQSSLLLVGEGRIEMANQAFCDYFGLEDTPGDLVGLTPRQMIDKIKNAYLHPEEQVKRIWEIARGGQPVIGEEMSMRDGRTSLRDFIPIYADGKSYGLLWHHIDITERKQAEEVLRERTQKLEEANKELESFAYSVSHDLRAPLRAIDGYARMILKKEGGRFDEDTTRKFNDIRSNAQMMGKLIDDILTLSRLGRAKMSMVDLEMEGIINDIWKEQQTINPERNMGLTVEAMPYGYGDRTLIKQVYANLIGNAVKFTKYKNPAQIKAGGYTKGNENIYYVKDNGVGFDMAYYDKLFGIFQRLHNNPDFEGTGVGLATIQRAVHRHGGRVWAEGKVNEGATFYFSLPSSHTHIIDGETAL